MGYTVPSADDVYRYVLRLDHRNRSLTDRFGLSILFINDTTPICNEFLQRYCIDLCLRTADRIRFIFFSDLPKESFQEIVERMNRSYMSNRQGMLQSILGMMGSHLRNILNPFDYEHDPWRTLRPEPFRPLGRYRDIKEHLDWRSDMMTAMPGIGESLKLAQKLGIGQYVPCFLVFSEVGDLHLDVLPIAGMSSEEAYSHVRKWVDDFYNDNRATIEHWERVEKSILGLCRKARRSLDQIREWPSQRLKTYDALRRVSQTILLIEEKNDKTCIHHVGNLEKDRSLPYEVRHILESLHTDLRKLAVREENCSLLRAACDRTRNVKDSTQLQNVLNSFKFELFPNLNIDRPRWLDEALYNLRVWLRSHQGPREELEKWWTSHGRSNALSFKKFQQQRKIWVEARITLTDDPGKEYEVMVKAVQALSPWHEASEGALVVFEALSTHYCFKKESETWLRASNGFRRHVTNYLLHACNSLPDWLRTNNSEILIKDALSSPDQQIPSNFEEYLDSMPIVRKSLEEAMVEYQSSSAEINRESAIFAHGLGTDIEKYIDNLATQNDVGEEERRSAINLALLHLRHQRVSLEKSLIKAEQETQKENVPVPAMDTAELLDLLESLDEYNKVTKRIILPHKRDPNLVKIYPVPDLSTTIGIERTNKILNADVELRENIDQAFKYDSVCRTTWENTRTQKVDWTPAARLSELLLSCLGSDRAKEVLYDYPGKVIQDKVKAASEKHLLKELLVKLNDNEISNILGTLNDEKLSVAQSESISKREKINLIMAEIGKFSGGSWPINMEPEGGDPVSRSLKGKIEKDEFDVFLAHNSVDKNEVLEICNALMSQGIHPWLDSEQIPPGQWFQDVIQSVIPRVKSAAILIGRHGIGRWQALELRAFISQCVERNIPVIPVLLPHTGGIPQELLFLRELNYVSFEGGTQNDAAIGKLVWGITGKKP